MLRWDWNKKIGTWTEEYGNKEYTYNLYSGNALLIMIAEWTEKNEKKYQLANFFCDKEHMNNCLGLNKGYENIFQASLKEITLVASYKYTPYIVQQIAKANFDNTITIKILPKNPW